ncbi:VWD domain-containing protein [Embleya sp. NPDC050154]|uniref:VWD domain-containing protein n=1 Tax=unclassified Embleya TaxID=2699296 RepID=UPI00379E3895
MFGSPFPRKSRRPRTVAAVLAAILLLLGACTSHDREDRDADRAAEPTAWEKVMAMTGPDGTVSTQMALSAFATAFGPIPGAQAQTGSRADLRSGSAALRWISGHWADLADDQRAAVRDLSGWGDLPIGSGGGTPAAGHTAGRSASLPQARATCAPGASADTVFASRIRDWWTKLAAKFGVPASTVIAACRTESLFTPSPGAPGIATVPASAGGWNDVTGPQCRIVMYPAFRASNMPDPLRDEVLVHELTHCVEGIIINNPSAFDAMPGWVAEGLADWAAGKLTGHYSSPGIWQNYLVRKDPVLTKLSYSAMGFWWELDYRGVDVWSTSRAAIAASANGTTPMSQAAFAAALGGKRQQVLEGWPASFLRDLARELAWDINGVGITGDKVKLSPPLVVASSKQTVRVTSPAFNPNLTPLDISAEVLRLAPNGPVFGRFGPGPGDYPLGAHMGDIFCTLGSKCECPEDTPGAGTRFEIIKPGRGFVAVSGGEVDASLGLTGQTLKSFCGEPKDKPKPRPSAPKCLAQCPDGPHGGSNGDPHLTTFDRLYYDFQAAGEFTLVASTDDDLRVQARQVPYPDVGDVSVNSAVAARVAGARVTFALDPKRGMTTVRLDGRPLAPGAQTPLPGGGTLARTGDGADARYALFWPDTTTLYITPIGAYGLKVDMALPQSRKRHVQGLLGNADGTATNDLDLGGGRVLARPSGGTPPSFDDLYHVYADHWRIRQEESLFDYEPGQSTATFTNRSFPRRPTQVATAPNADAARTQCTAAGVTIPEILDGCVLDVALTGRAEFAEAAAAQQEFLAGTPQTGMPDESDEPVEPPESVTRLGPFSGDATCTITGGWVAGCSGTLAATRPSATIRFAVEGFQKLLLVAETWADCRVRFAFFKDGDNTPLLGDRSICELQATPVEIGQPDHTIRLSSADPAVTLEYAFLMGGIR